MPLVGHVCTIVLFEYKYNSSHNISYADLHQATVGSEAPQVFPFTVPSQVFFPEILL